MKTKIPKEFRAQLKVLQATRKLKEKQQKLIVKLSEKLTAAESKLDAAYKIDDKYNKAIVRIQNELFRVRGELSMADVLRLSEPPRAKPVITEPTTNEPTN